MTVVTKENMDEPRKYLRELGKMKNVRISCFQFYQCENTNPGNNVCDYNENITPIRKQYNTIVK